MNTIFDAKTALAAKPAEYCKKVNEDHLMALYAPSGIQTWDVSVCPYLNFKHGDLDHSATTAGLHMGFSLDLICNLPTRFARRGIKLD